MNLRSLYSGAVRATRAPTASATKRRPSGCRSTARAREPASLAVSSNPSFRLLGACVLALRKPRRLAYTCVETFRRLGILIYAHSLPIAFEASICSCCCWPRWRTCRGTNWKLVLRRRLRLLGRARHCRWCVAVRIVCNHGKNAMTVHTSLTACARRSRVGLRSPAVADRRGLSWPRAPASLCYQ